MTDSRTWFLYMIECEGGSIYTGISVDVASRFDEHRRGKGARYTRAHPPIRLLAWQAYPDRSSASKAEYRIKQMSAKEKWAYASTLAGGMNVSCECSLQGV